MGRKSTKTQQARLAARRLVEDEEVQKQLRLAAVRVREAWGRASGRPASKAMSDKKVYDKLREAATSLSTAGRRLRRQPEPPKHTGRKVVAGAALAGGAAYAVKRRRAGGNEPEYDGQTVAAPPAPFPGSPLPVA
jgi:ATPase subunit of ABC transporter with duplicated ATPase domains